MESISDRLKSLGVQKGFAKKSESRDSRAQQGQRTLQSLLNGEVQTNFYGESLSIREVYPPEYRHGVTNLSHPIDTDVICKVSRLASDINLQLDEILFLDTETSGLGGGTGTFAFLIGLGFYTGQGFQVQQLFMRDPSEEPSMLAELIKITTRFKAVLTYNGKSFDIPLLNNRYILNGLTSPFIQYPHIDLLQITRKIWSNRFDNRSLGHLENQLLGFFRSGEEVPGWMIPQIYFDFLADHNPIPLSGVFYHNKIDILSLAGLTLLAGETLSYPNSTDIHQLDQLSVAKVYQTLGRTEEALSIYDQCIQKDLTPPQQLQAIMNSAEMCKRDRKWDLALPLWKEASRLGSIEACIEIAKYLEHTTKEYDDALAWTEKARMLILNQTSYYYQQMKLAEVEKRSRRIQQKTQREKSTNND
ncbi:hypothetical protein ADN00_00305 [Ornatilinea apprima]|uniref:YprB ribonuclease H-like domain-containing protein n=1 Tax=Ornatilinea apprima TaxID=1134406 RepID=A0A0P6XY41_9CHLR|nr:ribonuclease H-like domain-containing protein [Ornatilinea apprima]KPL81024.1 hypothetical protein ADN00_00305 [Ornatilinea apprima]